MTKLTITFRTIVFAFVGAGLLSEAPAVSPPPDGGYPGGNTAEGQNALLNLATGTYNTAVGFFSLGSNIGGTFNTATGAGALLVNTADNNTATGAGALLSNTTGDRTPRMGHSSCLTTQQEIRTRLRAFKRSFRIQPAPATQPVVARRLFPTQPDLKTPLLVLWHFKATPPATTIPPPVLLR
jgi:hypothetical protein